MYLVQIVYYISMFHIKDVLKQHTPASKLGSSNSTRTSINIIHDQTAIISQRHHGKKKNQRKSVTGKLANVEWLPHPVSSPDEDVPNLENTDSGGINGEAMQESNTKRWTKNTNPLLTGVSGGK